MLIRLRAALVRTEHRRAIAVGTGPTAAVVVVVVVVRSISSL